MDEDDEEEKIFLKTYAQSYGYSGKIEGIREKEFARLKNEVYLDHVGATQYPKSLLDRYFQDLSSNVYGNPHSRNPSSQLTTENINEIRNKILWHFNTNSDEYTVVFTAGATASLKIVAECFDWHQGSSKTKPSCLCFFQNSHTSVVGIREVAASCGANVLCIKDTNLLPSDECSLNSSHNNNINKLTKNQNSPTSQDPQDPGLETKDTISDCPNLFVFPAMCNFSGKKYPLELIDSLHNGALHPIGQNLIETSVKWFVLLDATSFVSSSYLDLQKYQADFIPVSFYKIFGFPTGIGALLVRNKSAHVLKKKYYGGGTVNATISSERFYVLKPSISDRFEDGTVAFLDILALGHAFDCLHQMTGTMQSICEHTFSIAQFVYKKMDAMIHGNGARVCKLYCDTNFSDHNSQGPVINFNLLRSNGVMIGYGEVDKFACLFNIHLRTGSFCNTGASQQHLGLSNTQLKSNYAAGHICGDNVDLVDGVPTGSVRISFGYMSTFSDGQKFLKFIRVCFIEKEAGTSSRCQNFINSLEPTIVNAINKKESISSTLNSCLTENRTGTHDSCQNSQAIDDGHLSTSLMLLNICIYPIKSCGAFEVSKWELGERGLKYDRQWMVINDSRICLSQKREPRLCLICPSIDQEKGVLTINAPDMPLLHVRLVLENKHPMSETDGFSAKIGMEWLKDVLDCGEEAANWMTSFLGKKCRLVQQNPDDCRASRVMQKGCKEVTSKSSLSLANVSQYLLISRESVSKLYQSIFESPEKNTVDSIDDLISRFRGNLVINGLKAFDEDEWQVIKIGQHLFEFQGLCSRCQMICLNQKTAERSVEPLKTLGLMRKTKTGTFGIGLQHSKSECDKCGNHSQLIQVGDPVFIIK